jgi:hypothetical protein
MLHEHRPFSSVIRNAQRTGKWQHAPHRMHLPRRRLSTGKTLVAVRFALAAHVLSFSSFFTISTITVKLLKSFKILYTLFSYFCNKILGNRVLDEVATSS